MTTYDRLHSLGKRISAVRHQIVAFDQEEELRKISSELYAEASLLIALDDVQLVKCGNCDGEGVVYYREDSSYDDDCYVCDGTKWVVEKR